jgi:hypothetical protein
MSESFKKVSDLIQEWGLEDIVTAGIGFLALLVVFFMPLKEVNHRDDYAGTTYAISIVAMGVTCVVAMPQIWRSTVGGIYAMCFCMVLGSLAIIRFRMGANEVKVVVKGIKDETPEAKKSA